MKLGFQTVPPGSYYKKTPDFWAVKKTMKKTITALLIMLLTTSVAGGLSFAAAEETETPQQTAETLLTVLDTSRAEVLALFDSMVEGGGEVPEDAQESFDEADRLRDEAQALYEKLDIPYYARQVEGSLQVVNAAIHAEMVASRQVAQELAVAREIQES